MSLWPISVVIASVWVATSSQQLPVDLSVARRRVVGWVGWPAAEFTSSCLSKWMGKRRTARGMARHCSS
jgi:hypothetical protein